ncbi:MAG: C4-dicarboxylate transporter DctA, partial [Methylococcales bacterium]
MKQIQSVSIRVPFYKNLTLQVLTAIAVGVLIGHYWPSTAVAMKPFGEAFIRLVKMVIAPVVFLTLVTGMSSMGDLKKVGRVGLKALIYFEIMTTFALLLGLLVVNLVRPGDDVKVAAAGTEVPQTTVGQPQGAVDFLLNILPDNAVNAFAKGDLLQVVFFAVLFGAALAGMDEHGKPIETLLEKLAQVFFGIIAMVMRVAPLGAFGAMAFTIGKYGIGSLVALGQVMFTVYLTMIFFIFGVLGALARYFGFSLWRFLVYIKQELLIVLGTSSSESVVPRMIEKMQRLGCARPIVGLVIPTGYSFNLDGTSIYLSIAVIFIAQAYRIDLDFGQQIGILALLMITSKGAAAVVGSAFVTLAATISATGVLPVEGLALLLGVDRFMAEARSITNLIGNGVATLVIARLERGFDDRAAPDTGVVL